MFLKRIAERSRASWTTGRREKREITARSTDHRGLTAILTPFYRAGTEQLVAVLDEYIEGMPAIVIKLWEWSTEIVGDL